MPKLFPGMDQRGWYQTADARYIFFLVMLGMRQNTSNPEQVLAVIFLLYCVNNQYISHLVL